MSLHSFSLFVPYRSPIYNDILHSGMMLLSQNAVLFILCMVVPAIVYMLLKGRDYFCLFLCISWNRMLLFGLQKEFS